MMYIILVYLMPRRLSMRWKTKNQLEVMMKHYWKYGKRQLLILPTLITTQTSP